MQSVRFILQRQCSRVGSLRLFQTSSSLNMPAKAGDKLPAADLFDGAPDKKFNLAAQKGKTVVVGVPGAFTPTCHKDHVPGVLANLDKLKAKGVSTVAVVAVNDPFVMAAWGKELNGGEVKFLADTCGEFTKGLDASIDVTQVLGNVRSKRYALVAEDGVIKAFSVEPDGIGLSCSRGTDILSLV